MGLADSKQNVTKRTVPSFVFDVKSNYVGMVTKKNNGFVKRGSINGGGGGGDWDTNHNQVTVPDCRSGGIVNSRPWPASCLGAVDQQISCWSDKRVDGTMYEEFLHEKEDANVFVVREVVDRKDFWEEKRYDAFKDEDEGIYDTLEGVLTCSLCNDVYCNYTCHLRCRPLVSLDCTTQTTDVDSYSPVTSPLFPDVEDLSELLEEHGNESCDISDEYSRSTFNGSELKKQIEAYNANTNNEITLLEDDRTFTGFLRVHMKLCRPINVVCTSRPTSIYDVLYEDESPSEKTLTSFYLPRDTVKSLHVTSDTTTKEVIITLLNKFKVVDNPHKFALYERDYEIGESTRVRMRRIQDNEQPLKLVLMWYVQGHVARHLVLQENDTGDIPWDAFSLPELGNFLRILEREEDEYLQQVRLKYALLAEKIRDVLEERQEMQRQVSSPSKIKDATTSTVVPPPRRRQLEASQTRPWDATICGFGDTVKSQSLPVRKLKKEMTSEKGGSGKR